MLSVLVHGERCFAIKCVVKRDYSRGLRGGVTETRGYCNGNVVLNKRSKRTAIVVHKCVGVIGVPTVKASYKVAADVAEPRNAKGRGGYVAVHSRHCHGLEGSLASAVYEILVANRPLVKGGYRLTVKEDSSVASVT